MRRSVVSSASRAAGAARHTTSTGPARLPFICASCKKVAIQRTISISPTAAPQRYISSAPNRQQQAAAATAPQHQRESVVPQTHFDFFPNTFPNGPPPNAPFTPDLQALRREFLQLQAKTHPDLAPASQKRQAEAKSSRVNEAYKAIQDPLKRAQYLLSLHGIDVEDESAKLEENELLMEVMEAREAVDEVENEEELVSIRKENNGRIGKSVNILEKAFASGEMETAAQEAIRLRYWMNIEESIHGWEKGQGGGIIHH